MSSRYLYCFVRADRDAAFDAAGIEDEPIDVVTADGVGAVVHDCDGLYDSDDPTTVKRWLLAHQSVVDAAGEAFGTPLPARFDTVIDGDDDRLAGWLADRADELRARLDEVAGHWEYRIGVSWDPSEFERDARESDDRLRELSERGAAAGEGTAYLLEQQADERLRELVDGRRRELQAALLDRIDPAVAAVEDDVEAATPDDEDGVTVAGVAVLSAQEDALGDRLDDYVDAHDVAVAFTGPWPPYSFAPEVDE